MFLPWPTENTSKYNFCAQACTRSLTRITRQLFVRYTCPCNHKGFKGKDCTVDINECTETRLCRNGAECTNSVGSYTCTCPKYWTGKDCARPNCNLAVIDAQKCASSALWCTAACWTVLGIVSRDDFADVCPNTRTLVEQTIRPYVRSNCSDQVRLEAPVVVASCDDVTLDASSSVLFNGAGDYNTEPGFSTYLPNPCGCDAMQFCNFTSSTGACNSCLDYQTAGSCFTGGLPAKGAQDCEHRCFPGTIARRTAWMWQLTAVDGQSPQKTKAPTKAPTMAGSWSSSSSSSWSSSPSQNDQTATAVANLIKKLASAKSSSVVLTMGTLPAGHTYTFRATSAPQGFWWRNTSTSSSSQATVTVDNSYGGTVQVAGAGAPVTIRHVRTEALQLDALRTGGACMNYSEFNASYLKFWWNASGVDISNASLSRGTWNTRHLFLSPAAFDGVSGPLALSIQTQITGNKTSGASFAPKPHIIHMSVELVAPRATNSAPSPPKAGRLVLYNYTTGYALANGSTLWSQTTADINSIVDAKAMGFEDDFADLPLRYAFSYTPGCSSSSGNDGWRHLASSASNGARLRLPSVTGWLTLRVAAIDARGEQSYATMCARAAPRPQATSAWDWKSIWDVFHGSVVSADSANANLMLAHGDDQAYLQMMNVVTETAASKASSWKSSSSAQFKEVIKNIVTGLRIVIWRSALAEPILIAQLHRLVAGISNPELFFGNKTALPFMSESTATDTLSVISRLLDSKTRERVTETATTRSAQLNTSLVGIDHILQNFLKLYPAGKSSKTVRHSCLFCPMHRPIARIELT